jgi:Zn-dependent protease with chaperone function
LTFVALGTEVEGQVGAPLDPGSAHQGGPDLVDPAASPAPAQAEASAAPPPVLQVPPVALPAPPVKARRGAGGNVGSAVAVLLLLLGAVLLNLAAVAFLLFITYMSRSPFLAIATLAFLLQLGRVAALFIRPPEGKVPGVRLEPGEEPMLEAFVADLAERVGTRPPDEISLIVDVNAMVSEVGPFLGLLRGTRRMAISVSLFDALDVSQLRAVLGHELGHYAGRHSRLTVLASKVEMALVLVIVQVGPRTFLGHLYVLYWRMHRRVGASVSRRQERSADQVAVRLAGRQATADALRTIEVADRVETTLRSGYLSPLLRDHQLPWDVQYGFWSLATDPWCLRRSLEEGEPVEPDPWATHPPLEERIRRVGELADPADVPPRDRRAARLLLKDPNDLTERVRVAWAQTVVGDVPLKRVTWEEGMARVNKAWTDEAAAEVDFVLLRMGMNVGLRGVYESHLAGRDRELVSRLVATGWRTGAKDEWQEVLRTVLMVAGARDGTTVGGHACALSWSGPVGLTDHAGEDLPLREWSEQAMAGDWGPLVRGLGLDQAPVPTAGELGSARSGRVRVAPEPPSPPFQRGTASWQWEVTVPGRLLHRHARIGIADAGIGLDGYVLRWEQIAHVTVGMRRQGKGAVADVVLVDLEGRTMKSHFAGASLRDGAIVGAVAGYCWDLLAFRTGERLAEDAMLRMAEGEVVEAGGLLFTRDGLAARRRARDVTPWSAVGDARTKGRGAEVPRTGGKPLKVDPNARDAVLIDRLIPQARALLA